MASGCIFRAHVRREPVDERHVLQLKRAPNVQLKPLGARATIPMRSGGTPSRITYEMKGKLNGSGF
jgi:hypothetical protein